MKKRSLYFFKLRADVSHKTVHGSRFLGVTVFAIECNTRVNHYILLKSLWYFRQQQNLSLLSLLIMNLDHIRLNVSSYQTIYLILFVGEVRAAFNTIRYVVVFGVMSHVVPSLSGNTSYLRDFSEINLNKLTVIVRLWKPSCMDIWGQCIVESGVLWEIWITVARGGSDSAVGYLAAFHSKFWLTFQLGWYKSCRKKIILANLLSSKGVEIYKRPDVSISVWHAVKRNHFKNRRISIQMVCASFSIKNDASKFHS